VIKTPDRGANAELIASSIVDPYIASPSQSQNRLLVLLGTSTRRLPNYFLNKRFLSFPEPNASETLIRRRYRSHNIRNWRIGFYRDFIP
jgi:hypothetical protein